MKKVILYVLLLNGFYLFAQLKVYAPAYPPMVIYDQDSGEISGHATEVVKQIVAEAGIDIELKILPWSNAYSKTRNGKNIMLYPVIRSPERELLFHWIGPVNKFHYGIYSLKPIEKEVDGLDNLGSARVGVLRGGLDSSYLKKHNYPNITEGNSIDLLINMLIKGRIEYLMVDDSTLKYYMGLNGLAKLTKVYRHLSLDDVTDNPYSYLVLSRNSDPIYLKKLKEVVSEMELW